MRKPKIIQINDTEELNRDIEVKSKPIAKSHKIKSGEETSTIGLDITSLDITLEKIMEKYSDKKVRFAKVNWGTGKGPYILAFEDSMTYDYCECNSHEFKPLKALDIKQNHVHIWECGSKLPEEINKLPTLNMEDYKNSMKKEKKEK